MPKQLRRFVDFQACPLDVDTALVLLFFSCALFWPDAVWAASTSLSLGAIICNIKNNIIPFAPLFNAIAFTVGIILVFRGVLFLKDHTEKPNDHPIVKGIAHILVGGALVSLKAFTGVIQETLHVTLSTGGATGCDASAVASTTDGLDIILKNFVANIYQPMFATLSALCYIIGVFLVIRGLLKAAKAGTDPRVGAPHVILANLLIGGVFLTAGSMVVSMTYTLFNTGSSNDFSSLINWSAITGETGGNTEAANTAVVAILKFIQIIGVIGFIRGWLIIKNAVEGTGQTTVPQGLTHVIGGAMAYNIDLMIRAFDTTLGRGLTS